MYTLGDIISYNLMQLTRRLLMKNSTVSSNFKNGWLDELDSRTAIAKEMRDRYTELTDDLGGLERLSYQQRSLAERSLWLEFWLSSQERTLAEGGEFDAGRWVQACNGLQGIYAKLGLDRITHNVNLSEIMAEVKL